MNRFSRLSRLSRLIRLFVLAVLTVALLASCEQLLNMLLSSSGVTIAERIQQFEADLNAADRSNIQKNFHPSMANYYQLSDPAVLEDGPLSSVNKTFNIGTPDIDGTYVTATFSHKYASGTIDLTMALDGDDYKIKRLDVTISQTTYTLKRLLIGQ